MNEPNFDHSEGNWEDFSQGSSWGESQWRGYLKNTDRETARFISIYNSLKDKPNHLDEVATQMGWDADDISLKDEMDEFSATDCNDLESINENESAPYTLHKHPVIVVTRGLYRYLHQSWEHYLNSETSITTSEHIKDGSSTTSLKTCWKYVQSLHQAEINVLLSVQALDLGDFGLTICHLKNSLTALNETLSILNQLNHPNKKFLEAFDKEVRTRLYDLRELWIRVIGDCRSECKRRPGREQD